VSVTTIKDNNTGQQMIGKWFIWPHVGNRDRERK
jgi:hypothetical protein